MSRTVIIGIGNPLMGDDGVGIAAVERLSAFSLPQGVEVVDGGTGGMTLLALMEGADAVVFIDAVEMGRVPGTIERFSLTDVLIHSPQGNLSLHQSGLHQVLELGRELGILPVVTLYGVQPEVVHPHLGLSPPLEQALASLVQRVLFDLAEVGRAL